MEEIKSVVNEESEFEKRNIVETFFLDLSVHQNSDTR